MRKGYFILLCTASFLIGQNGSRCQADVLIETNITQYVVIDAELLQIETNSLRVVSDNVLYTDGKLRVNRIYSENTGLQTNELLSVKHIEATDSEYIGSNMTIAIMILATNADGKICHIICSGMSRARPIADKMLKEQKMKSDANNPMELTP